MSVHTAMPSQQDRRSLAIGYGLITVGVLALMHSIGILHAIEWRYIGPIVLIAVGLALLFRGSRP